MCGGCLWATGVCGPQMPGGHLPTAARLGDGLLLSSFGSVSNLEHFSLCRHELSRKVWRNSI